MPAETSPPLPVTTEGTLSGGRRRNPYRVILEHPGAARFSMAAAVARLPMSMVGIGIVLMVEGLYDSYAMGGRVSAAYVVAQAICSPQIARLVDRHGQAKVMRPLLVVTSLSLISLIVAALLAVAEPVLWVPAILTGASIGSVGAFVRARWNHLLTSPRELHTAYSLESAVDELIFVVGPVITTTLATSLHPAAGLVLPIVAVIVGGTWFYSQRGTEPPAAAGDGAAQAHGDQTTAAAPVRQPGVLRNKAMIAIVLIFIFIGVVFGSVDVSVLAFAEEQHREGSAGLVLGAFALGSLVAGLGYGLRHWRSRPTTRLLVTATMMMAGVAWLPAAQNLPTLAVMVFFTGFSVAPTLITGNELVHLVVSPQQFTEGMAWVGTALGVGVSFGSSIAGSRIDEVSAGAGFWVAVLGAVVSLALTAVTWALITVRNRAAHRASQAG